MFSLFIQNPTLDAAMDTSKVWETHPLNDNHHQLTSSGIDRWAKVNDKKKKVGIMRDDMVQVVGQVDSRQGHIIKPEPLGTSGTSQFFSAHLIHFE